MVHFVGAGKPLKQQYYLILYLKMSAIVVFILSFSLHDWVPWPHQTFLEVPLDKGKRTFVTATHLNEFPN